MSDIRIPGPGAAMALAAGAAAYAASQAKTTHFGGVILLVATFFGFCTLSIENLHVKGALIPWWGQKPEEKLITLSKIDKKKLK